MALPSVTDVKSYLRIQTNAEDVLLGALIAEALGACEMHVGRSFTSEEVTWFDDARSGRMYAAVTRLFLQYVPVDAASVEITDADGVAVDASTYSVRQDIGMVVGKAGVTFPNGPYTITADAGFQHSATYATRELPMIRQLLIDYTAMLYQQRTPGAASEKAAGTTVDFSQIDEGLNLPKRIAGVIKTLRGPIYASI